MARAPTTRSVGRIQQSSILGAYFNTQRSFAGAMDETAIYDRALSLAEIQAIVSAGASGKSAMACFAGTYSGNGLFPGTLSPLGYYVPLPGATAPIPAPAGSYVNNFGAISARLAEPGYYAPGTASINQIPAPAGRYVPTAGASAPILASPGHYVDTIAARLRSLRSRILHTH